jgi:hypothetical protein
LAGREPVEKDSDQTVRVPGTGIVHQKTDGITRKRRELLRHLTATVAARSGAHYAVCVAGATHGQKNIKAKNTSANKAVTKKAVKKAPKKGTPKKGTKKLITKRAKKAKTKKTSKTSAKKKVRPTPPQLMAP